MFLLFLKLDVTHRAAQKEPDLDDSQTVSTANIEHKQTTKTIHFKYTWGRKVMTVKKKKKKKLKKRKKFGCYIQSSGKDKNR